MTVRTGRQPNSVSLIIAEKFACIRLEKMQSYRLTRKKNLTDGSRKIRSRRRASLKRNQNIRIFIVRRYDLAYKKAR